MVIKSMLAKSMTFSIMIGIMSSVIVVFSFMWVVGGMSSITKSVMVSIPAMLNFMMVVMVKVVVQWVTKLSLVMLLRVWTANVLSSMMIIPIITSVVISMVISVIVAVSICMSIMTVISEIILGFF